MAKVCRYNDCNYPVFGGGYCKFHQGHRTDGKKPKPMSHYANKDSKSRKSSINKKSEKQSKADRVYSRERKDFLLKPENKFCKKRGCNNRANEVHHKLHVRTGAALLDKKWWLPLCTNCHRWVHENPQKAIKEDLLATAKEKYEYFQKQVYPFL